MWTVEHHSYKTDKYGRNIQICLCKCNECGFEKKTAFKGSLNNGCYKCRMSKLEGYTSPERIYYTSVKSRAKQREIPFNLSVKFMFDLLKKQNFKCQLTGWDISIENHTASLDRKDSSKPYIKSNVQWVHKDINFCKGSFSKERFVEICNSVSKENYLQ